MYPSLDAGPLSFPSWFTLLLVGFCAAIVLAWRDAPRLGIARRDALDLSLLMMLAGLLGARALHILADGALMDYIHLCTDPLAVGGAAPPAPCATDATCLSAGLGALCDTSTGLCHPARDCLRALKLWTGGFAWYGGVAAAVPAGILLARRRAVAPWRALDLLAPPAAAGLALGRLGCFLSGCCYGTVTPHGVPFPAGSPPWRAHVQAGLIDAHAVASLPVHPTQLYEAAAAAVLFVWLWWRRGRTRVAGEQILLLLAVYGAARFLIETLRADARGLWSPWGLSTSQLIAAPVVVGALLLLRARRVGGPIAP